VDRDRLRLNPLQELLVCGLEFALGTDSRVHIVARRDLTVRVRDCCLVLSGDVARGRGLLVGVGVGSCDAWDGVLVVLG